MTKDALEKIIESVVDWSRAYQHALDQWPEKEAVACESELKIAKAKLLAALAPEPNQPKAIGEHMLTRKVLVRAFENGELYAVDDAFDDSGKPCTRYLGAVCDITGHWEPITPEKG